MNILIILAFLYRKNRPTTGWIMEPITWDIELLIAFVAFWALILLVSNVLERKRW